jgi:integrase
VRVRQCSGVGPPADDALPGRCSVRPARRSGTRGRWLGATTPLSPEALSVMAQLGPRMLFYDADRPRKSVAELVALAQRDDPELTKDRCREATRAVVLALYDRYPRTKLRSSFITLSDGHLRWLALWSEVLGKLRAGISASVVREEHPERVLGMLKNFAIGSAVVHGRRRVNAYDLAQVGHIAVSSGVEGRARALRAALALGGTGTAPEIEHSANISRPTAHRYMKELASVGLASFSAGNGKEGGVSAATINRRMAALRKSVRLAVRFKLAATRIEVPHLEENAPRDGFLSPADFAALAEHLPDDGLRTFVRFLYATGMRVGEARKLEWRDVDGTVLRIRGETTKNGAARTLPIAGAVAEALSEARLRRRLECPTIFHRDGRPIGLFRKSWMTATKAAGHPALLVHDLRRSAVRNLIRSGVPERIAMGVTGHKTRNVFDRYNIVSAADLGAGLETVGAYLATASKTATITPLHARDSDKLSESEPATALSR